MRPENVSLALQSDKTAADYRRLGAAVEHYGFGGLSVFADLGYQPPLAPLLAAASVTERVRLGAAAMNPFFSHPVDIAGQVAVLDEASGGRAYCGLVRGSWLDQVGVEAPRPLRRLAETIDVVTMLLAGDDSGYEGSEIHIAPGFRLRYPRVRPRVDILLGVWGPKGAELAARSADEVKLGGCANPDMVRLMRSWLDEGATAAGRAADAVGVVAGAVTVVDEDREAARRKARSEVAMYIDVVAPLDRTVEVPEEVLTRLREHLRAGDVEKAGAVLPDDLVDRFCFAGTPADIVDHSLALFEAGAGRVEFGTPHGLTDDGGIELLGTQVLPALLGETAQAAR